MKGVNKVILIGHLGKDPEVKYLDGNNVVANFPLATSESYVNKEGQRIDQTEWHNIVVWRKLAEIAEKYLKKGSLIYLEGSIRTRSWEDQEGQKKYRTEILCQNFNMLDKRPDSGNGNSNTNKPAQANTSPPKPAETKQPQPESTFTDSVDDDLPF